MKSYGHLWEKFISDDNVKLAIHNYAKGKRKRREVKAYLADEEAAVAKLKDIAEHYKNARHVPKQIYDGITRKKRTIIVPKAHEQVVHHMIVNVLSPIIMHGMYEHSNGSIPGRGAHRGKKSIERWLHHQTRNVKYCLKMDIRKFFDSIPHEILIAKLERVIRDERFMELLREIISVTEVGLPLGFYTSQWLANWYLQDLDHFIKEDLDAPHYMRYMDDMVIFGPSKKKLHRMREEIDAYLRRELGLELKDNWQVFRYSYKDGEGNDRGRDLDFMGFRFFRDRTVLRRHIMLKASRKARRIARKKKPTLFEIRQMMSYVGWIKHTMTHGFYLRWIRPFVNLKTLRRRLSNYDKRQREKEARDGLDLRTEHGASGGIRHHELQAVQFCPS